MRKAGSRGDRPFRRRWFVPVPEAESPAELNARLAEADAAEDARHVAGRAASIGEDFAAERGLLLYVGLRLTLPGVVVT